jgi:RimJ/RimL family protein N-acetyltransferase
MEHRGAVPRTTHKCHTRACRDWGFASLELPYLTAMIHPDNDASIRLARRLGVAPLRSDVLGGDPVTVFSLNRDDWSNAR